MTTVDKYCPYLGPIRAHNIHTPALRLNSRQELNDARFKIKSDPIDPRFAFIDNGVVSIE